MINFRIQFFTLIATFMTLTLDAQCDRCHCQTDVTWRSVANLTNDYQSLDDGREITIPIIFHIVGSKGDFEQLKASLLKQVEYLSRDFMLLNTDTVSVNPMYKPLISNANIRFVLADTIIQQGIGPGFVRADRRLKKYMELSSSPILPSQYLNVYIGKIWASSGYVDACSWENSSYFPHVVHVQRSLVEDDERLLTHEVGHWLGLWHIFDGGCSSDGDEVVDTPPQVSASNAKNANDFMSVKCVDNIPMVNNYMDYSSCRCMFTVQQVRTMRLFIRFNMPKLWSQGKRI